MASRVVETAEKYGLEVRGTGERVPLAGVSVEAQIREGSVRTVVAQRYVNRGERPVEAVYTFPLGDRAAVRRRPAGPDDGNGRAL